LASLLWPAQAGARHVLLWALGARAFSRTLQLIGASANFTVTGLS